MATFATQAAWASEPIALEDPFTLSVYAKCPAEDCNEASDAVLTKTVGKEMIGTNMKDYWANGKGEDAKEGGVVRNFDGTRKIGEIVFKATTDEVGEEFWVDDPSKDGMHISCHVTIPTDSHLQDPSYNIIASGGTSEEGIQGAIQIKCGDSALDLYEAPKV